MGNPNVGKSAIFSQLTGVHVIASNYPGTTVGFTQGVMKIDGETVTLIDVPGTYGLDAASKAEEIAVRMLEDGDAVINVVDATNLERNILHAVSQTQALDTYSHIACLNITRWEEVREFTANHQADDRRDIQAGSTARVDDFAVAQNRYVVRQTDDLLESVGDVHDRDALGPKPPHCCEQMLALCFRQ